ncbi:daunorubicin resistance protein DrrA family ABC transporter ATP-binding protein [Sinomonas cyclohexanicum]|uniref:Daunorubicin resistance protein DrrA family ABC transporter ATP-binding protein n=1 Tax=Sinomonas cyclohexanicum TaxID=322009 RepID=A0ABM7PQ00_SINCY|nr:ATP-binding cassette domain-containing protein [Corynebacterium cyclohexanicum]BCT74265.1 daunorubicin resistance protein DrrA family ABC transporter ATP-binding protein [Corynebacterium cyclohexanicum]
MNGVPAIQVRDLVKAFGEVTAVDHLSFDVAHGEVFAFLGPNGAGKSTAINVLCTLAAPTAGSASVAGFDVVRSAQQVRAHIGLVFQETTLDKQLTAEENLRFHAVLYGVPRSERTLRIEHVLELVGLGSRRKDLVATFSGGMARRLEIARAMLHTPAVLFLDEPTIGLDPQTRTVMWEDILALRRDEGVTVFMTTHYMDEAEVADRIGIIDHGRLIALGTPEELKAAAGAESIILRTADDGAARLALEAAGYRCGSVGAGVSVETADAATELPAVIALLGGSVLSAQVHEPSLDDMFLHYTGRQIRDQAEQPQGFPPAWRSRR